jgi:hypothetical protein
MALLYALDVSILQRKEEQDGNKSMSFWLLDNFHILQAVADVFLRMQEIFLFCLVLLQNILPFKIIYVKFRTSSETAVSVGTRSDPVLDARALSDEHHCLGVQGSARRDPAGLGPGTVLPANGTSKHQEQTHA